MPEDDTTPEQPSEQAIPVLTTQQVALGVATNREAVTAFPSNLVNPTREEIYANQFATLERIRSELDEVFNNRVDTGEIWGVAIVIAVDAKVQQEFMYLPDPDKPGITEEQSFQAAGLKRMTCAVMIGYITRLVRLLAGFFSHELGGIPIIGNRP